MEETGLRGACRHVGPTAARTVAAGASAWSRDEGPAPGAGETDRLPGAAVGDDAVRRVDQAGHGDRERSSGGSSAARGGGADGLRGHALDSPACRSAVAPAVHRTERRLGAVHWLGLSALSRATPEP